MNSFTKRFIAKSILVIFVVFLTIYFLFNQLTEDLIRSSAEPYLTVQIRDRSAHVVSIVFDLNYGWEVMPIEDAVRDFLDLHEDAATLDSLAFAIISDRLLDNYIIINYHDHIAAPRNLYHHDLHHLQHYDSVVDKHLFLAEYYMENRALFQIGETIPIHIGDHLFYVRSVVIDYVEGIDWQFPTPPYPLTILLYTEVTDMIEFKNTVNQILLIALSLSGIIILAVTIRMSSKFKQSIEKLANYAKKIGHGSFDAEVEELKYSEFRSLARSMTDMSIMLATYESNQKQFFQNASHELRTPLMAIQCYNDGILADVFEPDEAANIIKVEIEKMTELVSSILYLSRIDHHHAQLKPTSANDFLTSCRDQIKVLADNNHITTSYTPLGEDIQINIDEQLFERAILNILTNALRYAKKEIIIITDTYLERDTFTNIKQEFLIINISNDGPPINETDIPHLFERFYKGDGGNTGLGLAIAKEIVTSFDGHISVKNLNDGVCFTIELPV